MNNKLKKISELLILGKHLETEKITLELIEEGIKPEVILEEGLMPGMNIVGQRFRDQQMFVPQVLVAARAMKFSMKILEPLMIGSNHKSKGKILLGTVKGDVHDIGKNLVGIMLQGAGYDVIDLGIGITAEKYYEEYEKNEPVIIGMSALLTTTMIYMKDVINLFEQKNIKIPIIVGGAPLNKKIANEMGAAGFGKSAYEAVQLVDSLITKIS
jgi:5-methyltetrahydrofolate--homocysteine methyltransferase